MKKMFFSVIIALLYITPLKEKYVYIPREIAVENTENKPYIEVKKKIEKIPVQLTAYDNDYACTQSGKGITASGIVASRGTLAVPKNIPLGTIFYINGVKHIAHDRGGRIKIVNGVYVIDVWVETHKEALQFGRKKGYMYKQGNEYYIEVEG